MINLFFLFREKLFVMIQGAAGAFSFIMALLSVVYMPVADALGNTVGENIIATTKIRNNYGAIQSFIFLILR